MEPDKILTVPDVAKYLKISRAKTYALVQRGEIPSIKLGRNVRIRESDLLAWIESQVRKPAGK